MSRSGYSDDFDDQWGLIKYRGQVASAIRGKRGQAFLRELIETLDAMPEKELFYGQLQSTEGSVCALGSVGVKRGLEMTSLNSHNNHHLADVFGIAHQLIAEIEYQNDEILYYDAPPEGRWRHMRDWATRHLVEWDVV